ncbi:hypothetical protein J2Y48_004837 [Mycoplana sp. BE70]|uniref:hypothetical protein n=1 Tax=Mycoplana sp. BE70 TaxID=2817775 RepID=UPI00285A371A|nr:hypothetical protein [Mycoplana sp. BE70]MDR6759521.1 hypothetical protein [Mycoplana sp. BE70]
MTKIMAITAVALCIGTAAFAQGTGGGGTTTGSGASGMSGSATTGSGGGVGTTSGAGGMSHSGAGAAMQMPNGWSGHIGTAFFRDENGATARSARDIKKNWKSLNQQEQAQVRSDCQKAASTAPGSTGSLTSKSMRRVCGVIHRM